MDGSESSSIVAEFNAEFKTDSAFTPNVQICLPVRGEQIAFLDIPRSDIRRLATRPFKWMRFVMFCICGVRGDLSGKPDGPPVDYDSTSVDGDRYYYRPPSEERYSFVDSKCLNDRITSSQQTQRRSDVRVKVRRRDGECCVVTAQRVRDCDAAHLIPRCKGSEYIVAVIQNRSRCHPSAETTSISDIDDVENAILLYKGVHSKLADGQVAFLKTPNFAMDSTDIPRLARVPAGTDAITLHRLNEPDDYDAAEAQGLLDRMASGYSPRPSTAFYTGLNVDALFQGTTGAQRLPPAIILDFVYGVAACKWWSSPAPEDVVNDYGIQHWKPTLLVLPPQPDDQAGDGSSDTDFDAGSEPDPTYHPPSDDGGDSGDDADAGPKSDKSFHPPVKKTKWMHVSERGNELSDAMDKMNRILMYLSGTTPEEVAERQEKQLEEEEQALQEAGRSKVRGWMKTSLMTNTLRLPVWDGRGSEFGVADSDIMDPDIVDEF